MPDWFVAFDAKFFVVVDYLHSQHFMSFNELSYEEILRKAMHFQVRLD
jgi:hypothetical protein